MTTLIALVTMTTVVAGLVAALDHNHRRTAHLPRAPFGADVEADADLARIRRDLAVASTRTSTTHHAAGRGVRALAQSSGSSSRASHVAKRSTAASNSGCVSVNS